MQNSFPIKKNTLTKICKAAKILKTSSNIVLQKLFKQSHFVKCQVVFNFTRRLFQAHYDKRSLNLRVIVDLHF